MHVILLKTIYEMSSHQNLSIRLISILLFSQLPSFTYRSRQYLLRETKIRFIVSARCTNTVTIDRFPELAKFPGLYSRIQSKYQKKKSAFGYFTQCMLKFKTQIIITKTQQQDWIQIIGSKILDLQSSLLSLLTCLIL